MNSEQFNKLRSAVSRSYRALEPFRKLQREGLQQMCGPHYGENREMDSMPVNMLELVVSTLLQELVAKEPQCLVLTRNIGLRASAADFELAMNEKLLRMNAGEELKAFVMSAMFSMGIMRVGLTQGATVTFGDEPVTNTEIFMEAIQFDDWVHDTTAKQWRQHLVRFCGHRYRRSLEDVRNDENYDPEVRQKVQSTTRATVVGEMPNDSETSDDLAFGREELEDQFDLYPTVELWDIFIPREQLVVTYAAGCDRPLREAKWMGPPDGPYRTFGFKHVLNNTMPLPLVANWMDMHDLVNKLYAKLGDQSSRQKTLTFATPNDKVDAGTIMKAGDGDVITVKNPQGIKEARYGGVDQQTLGFAIHARDVVSYIMGNLDAMAGLGQQADTVGQEKIIKESGNQRLRAMQSAVMKVFRAILRDIAWWMWNNPMEDMQLTKRISGTDIEINTSWPIQEEWNGFEYVESDVREGVDFNVFQIDIEPYSLQDISPSERMQAIRTIWQQDIIPLQQMGVVPDVEQYLRLISKYGDLPEIDALATLSPDPMMSKAGGGSAMPSTGFGKPNGQYTRTNVSGGMTPQAASQQAMMTAMTAGQPQ
jgi:hypothetical protein